MPGVPSPLGAPFGLIVPGAKGAARPHGTTLMMHDGVDLAAEMGTPIQAAGDGIVIGAEPKGGYGNWIEIEHDDASTVLVVAHHEVLQAVTGHFRKLSLPEMWNVWVDHCEVLEFELE